MLEQDAVCMYSFSKKTQKKLGGGLFSDGRQVSHMTTCDQEHRSVFIILDNESMQLLPI